MIGWCLLLPLSCTLTSHTLTSHSRLLHLLQTHIYRLNPPSIKHTRYEDPDQELDTSDSDYDKGDAVLAREYATIATLRSTGSALYGLSMKDTLGL